jgi:hypothetical protein
VITAPELQRVAGGGPLQLRPGVEPAARTTC